MKFSEFLFKFTTPSSSPKDASVWYAPYIPLQMVSNRSLLTQFHIDDATYDELIADIFVDSKLGKN